MFPLSQRVPEAPYRGLNGRARDAFQLGLTPLGQIPSNSPPCCCVYMTFGNRWSS
jgi:hypothetical protein